MLSLETHSFDGDRVKTNVMKRPLATIVVIVLCCGFISSKAQTNTAKLSTEQIKEERAYTAGIQALVWGRPLMEYNKTIYAEVKAGAAYTSYFRRYDNLKTAADRFVVTPNKRYHRCLCEC